jgi:hypothetical protein
MLIRSAFLSSLVIALSATPAFCDDHAPPSATDGAGATVVKPRPVAKKPKLPSKAPTTGSLNDIQFSRPNAPPVGAQKGAAQASQATKAAGPSEPQGGVSLDLQWHASNDKTDPYDAVRHTSGPNGPGDGVLGGIKLGF